MRKWTLIAGIAGTLAAHQHLAAQAIGIKSAETIEIVYDAEVEAEKLNS